MRTLEEIVADDQLWTVKDVATYLQVSTSWVYQQVESGKLPALRIGNMLRFHPETIKAFAVGELKPATVLPLVRK